MTIHIYVNKHTAVKAKDAEYNPREYARISDKIKEVKELISQTKIEARRNGLLRTLASYEEQLKKYRTDDAFSVATVEKEIAQQEKLMRVFEKSGKPIPGTLLSRLKFLKEELEKAKSSTDDAGGNFESLSANDVMEKYGATFLARVRKAKEATAPDGKIVRVDGSRFVVKDATMSR